MNPYIKAIEHFGEEAQLKKTLEELKELRLEVRRALNGRLDREALVSEMSDVCNMIAQLGWIYAISQEEISYEANRKMQRTMERIQKEKESEGE